MWHEYSILTRFNLTEFPPLQWLCRRKPYGKENLFIPHHRTLNRIADSSSSSYILKCFHQGVWKQLSWGEGMGKERKKNTRSCLVEFWAHFYCHSSQCLGEQGLFAVQTPQLWKTIPTPWFHPLQQWHPTARALARSFVSKLEKQGSGCRKGNLPAFLQKRALSLIIYTFRGTSTQTCETRPRQTPFPVLQIL